MGCPKKKKPHLRPLEKRLFAKKLRSFGSSYWTRTSDIRINSPPFYRLN